MRARQPAERPELAAPRRRKQLADWRSRLRAPAGASCRARFGVAPCAPAHQLRAAAEHGPPDSHDVHGARQHERRRQPVASAQVEAAARSQLPQRGRGDTSLRVNRAARHRTEVGGERGELGRLRALGSSRRRTLPRWPRQHLRDARALCWRCWGGNCGLFDAYQEPYYY